MSNYLKVTHVENKIDKNKIPYQVVTFEGYTALGNNLIKTGRTQVRNLRPARGNFRADPFYPVNTGDIVVGEIRQFNKTTSYMIGDRQVNSCKIVLLGEDEITNAVKTANFQLYSKGCCVVDENGQMTNPSQVKSPEVVEVTQDVDADTNEF